MGQQEAKAVFIEGREREQVQTVFGRLGKERRGSYLCLGSGVVIEDHGLAPRTWLE